MRRMRTDPSAVDGSFRLRFDDDHPLLRLYAFGSRSRRALFTYGDQGLYLRRATFEAIGGFRPLALMEDVEIQRRQRRLGRCVKRREPIVTSARRFRAHGVLRQQLRNVGLVLAYHAGADPARLARWYGRSRS